jgi:hypothetical protein
MNVVVITGTVEVLYAHSRGLLNLHSAETLWYFLSSPYIRPLNNNWLWWPIYFFQVLRYSDGTAKGSRFDSRQGQYCLFTAPRSTLEYSKSLINWIWWGSFFASKAAGAWSWPLTCLAPPHPAVVHIYILTRLLLTNHRIVRRIVTCQQKDS